MNTGATKAGESSPEEHSLDYDVCFDLLSNHRRRYTLHYLKQNGSTADLGELSEQIAAWENGISQDRISYDQRKRVYTSLQQVHLPKLDELGIIEFDEREGVATLSQGAEKLDIYFDVVNQRTIPWSVVYLLLVVLNSAVLAVGALGIPPFSSIPDIGWVVFVLITFLVTSLAHLYLTHTGTHLGKNERPPELST